MQQGMLLVSAWLTALLYLISGQFADVDLWGRLSIAALYFQSGRFPYHDVFSYTAEGARWIDHEWLTGFVFYQVLLNWGEPGFLMLKYLLILAVLALLFWLHRRIHGASPLYTFYGLLLLLAIYSVGFDATLRAQAFTFLFFTGFLAVLEGLRLEKLNRRWLWLLLPAGVVWGNLHGGFVMGCLLLLAYGLGEVLRQRRLKVLLPYAGLALLIVGVLGFVNPYGPAYIRFLWHAWSLDRDYILEWRALNLASWRFLPAQLLAMMTMVMLLMRWLYCREDRRRGSECRDLATPALVLLWLLVMTLKGIRFQTFLALAVVGYAPLVLSPAFLQWFAPAFATRLWSRYQTAFARIVPGMLLLMSLGGLIYLHNTVGIFRLPLADALAQSGTAGTRYPLGAINYLRQSPYQGNLLVRFGLGEFAYWALYPRFKVSMDGRYEEVYSQAAFERNRVFFSSEHLPDVVRAFQRETAGPADFVLIGNDSLALHLLLESPQWRLLYANGYFALFGKQSSLQKLPDYNPSQTFMTLGTMTLKDLFTPEDLARFRN